MSNTLAVNSDATYHDVLNKLFMELVCQAGGHQAIERIISTIPDPTQEEIDVIEGERYTVCGGCGHVAAIVDEHLFHNEAFQVCPGCQVENFYPVLTKQSGDFQNPYLREFVRLYRFGGKFSIARHIGREAMVHKYAWAIPNEEAIKAISQRGPIIEIGAGRGYWAWCLSQIGTEVVAFDAELPPNNYLQISDKLFHHVQLGDAKKVVEYPRHTLLLVWPPYRDSMALEALLWYRGEYLIFVGEGDGSCCGCNMFWEFIRSEWRKVGCVKIPQHHGLNDLLLVFRRSCRNNFKRRVVKKRISCSKKLNSLRDKRDFRWSIKYGF